MSEPKHHTMADHMLGLLAGHAHGPDDDHDHDHDEADFLPDSPHAHDVPLTSIGVDIGSSGTQVIFSKLIVRSAGTGRHCASREVLYQSPIGLTPFRSDGLIDTARVSAMVDDAFAQAGLHPDDIDTGVAILTGEAAHRRNAPVLLHDLAERCGDLVSAAAGHHMEAAIAAYGSGAVDWSHDQQSVVLNIDIGGSTTKLSWIDKGAIVSTAALQIGGRVVAFDRDNRITRLDAAASSRAAEHGLNWAVGGIVSTHDLNIVANAMADDLVTVLTRGWQAVPAGIRLTEAPIVPTDVQSVRVSGGVGEYVYRHERREFGDLGRRLGAALRAHFDDGRLPWRLLPAGACIRATALGASAFQTQISGATGAITAPGRVLPRRNLPVWRPRLDLAGDVSANRVAAAIRDHRAAFGEIDGDVALALAWSGDPTHARLLAVAQGVADGLADRLAAQRPLFILLDQDIAQSLGGILHDELKVGVDLMVVDGLALQDFDYVDIGRMRLPSGTVPVTVKSLIFGLDQTSAHHVHHHGAHHHRHD